MSNEVETKQTATATLLDDTEKKLSLLKGLIGQLEERLSAVLLPDDKKETMIVGVGTEGMSPLKRRLTANACDIDRAIEKVERIINLVEV